VSARILVVDDDPGILDVVRFSLASEGFDVEAAADGASALELARSGGYELLVLDVMLPDIPGTEVCRQLRSEGSSVPILMLTARDAEVDRVVGLELGADDYVPKPFSRAELVSRVRAILRRRELDRAEAAAPVRDVGGVRLDFARHEIRVDGEPVQLTPSEFKILALLAERPGEVFSRAEIMRHLWGSDHVGDEHPCDVHVSNIRRKIERHPARPERLVTVRGAGYKLSVR
jgi:two-component system, OmpR family, response regulator RegX3